MDNQSLPNSYGIISNDGCPLRYSNPSCERQQMPPQQARQPHALFTRRPPIITSGNLTRTNQRRAMATQSTNEHPKARQSMSNARQRREKENTMFEELGGLLPFAAAITMQLDKASIVRLTCAYIKLIRQFPNGVRLLQPPTVQRIGFEPTQILGELRLLGKHFATSLIMAIDGFILFLSADGTIMYVSEGASVHVGMSQFELIGNSLTDFVHDDDLSVLRRAMVIHARDRDELYARPAGYVHQMEINLTFRMRCVLAKRNAGLTDEGHKVVHCTGFAYARRAAGGTLEHLGLMLHAVTLPAYQITEMRLADDMFVFRTDLGLRLTYVDAIAGDLTGLDLCELQGRSLYSLLTPHDAHILARAHKTVLHTHQSTSGYHRWMARDGREVWVQTNFFLMHMPRASRPHQIVGVVTIIGEDAPSIGQQVVPHFATSTESIPTISQLYNSHIVL